MIPCDQCREREAVVHLTQIANDQKVELHLCERCAAERGVETVATLGKIPVGSFVAALGKSSETMSALAGIAAAGACPACGATLTDFRESGRLGCSQCYQAFEAPLRDLLRRVHGSSRHRGERYTPAGDGTEAEVSTMVELRDQLKAAVQTENFELAAELRDRLRAVEEEG